jgi:hypothetical protein
MRLTLPSVALCAGVAACGLIPANDTARMPLNQYGGPVMSQSEAMRLSSYALMDPAVTHGNPALAARAIAAEDWLAGQDMLMPDFNQYQPVNQVSWGEFRRQVRSAIGIAPGTPSRVVVDRLLAASDALKAGNSATAKAQLQPPAFTLGPEGTIAALGNLPELSNASWAFTELSNNECPVNATSC